MLADGCSPSATRVHCRNAALKARAARRSGGRALEKAAGAAAEQITARLPPSRKHDP